MMCQWDWQSLQAAREFVSILPLSANQHVIKRELHHSRTCELALAARRDATLSKETAAKPASQHMWHTTTTTTTTTRTKK
jgi:hypothetical protein